MTSRTPSDLSSDLHELAGEYVLGTLSAAQRREVQDRLIHDAALRAAVHAWEERLLPLAALAEPIAPSPRLWLRIARSLDAQTPTTSSRSTAPCMWKGWNSLAFWRGLSGASLATAAALLAVLLARPAATPEVPQFIAVLTAPQSQAPGWVIQASTDREVRLIPLAKTPLQADKALEFWTKADGWSGPISLGLVKPGESLLIPLDKLPPLQADQLFELTLEPANGSPIGKPTGPIQFIGRTVKTL